MKYFLRVVFFWVVKLNAFAGFPQYYCTACNWNYFECLLSFIGSLHETNFDHMAELAVFDLGLTSDQVEKLNSIQKVSVHPLEKADPTITSYYRNHGIVCLGWYAWKPIAIKQALELFPYVLYLDSGPRF